MNPYRREIGGQQCREKVFIAWSPNGSTATRQSEHNEGMNYDAGISWIPLYAEAYKVNAEGKKIAPFRNIAVIFAHYMIGASGSARESELLYKNQLARCQRDRYLF